MKKIFYLGLVIALIIISLFFYQHFFKTSDQSEVTKKKSTTEKKIQDYPTNDTIIDSDDNFKKLINKSEAPSSVIDSLALVNLNYWGFDNKVHQGQLIVNKKCKSSIKRIFNELLKIRFPIYSMMPISYFNWNDSLSMANNNTSSFNYRTVDGSNKMSDHAYGLAIDVNPFLNPYVKGNNYSRPINAIYNEEEPGTIVKNSKVVAIFKKHGWKWGGNYKTIKDYQHFYY